MTVITRFQGCDISQRLVSNESEVNQLRADLKHLYDWSVDWQMLFNTEKCKVMHFGHSDVAGTYSLGDNYITDCNQEKDLGVIVSSTLKSSSQCVAAANSANRTLGMINLKERLLTGIGILC